MSSQAQPTYFHYRSEDRTSLSAKHFADKIADLSDKNNSEKMYQNLNNFIKVPEPLPRQSKTRPISVDYPKSKIPSTNSFSNSGSVLKRHSSTSSVDKIQYFSNFPQRSRSRSADFEEMKNEFNAKCAQENPEIRTFDRIQNYRLEKNFVTYTEQPANGFTRTYQSDEDLSPNSNNYNSNNPPKFFNLQMSAANGLRKSVQVKKYLGQCNIFFVHFYRCYRRPCLI